MSPRRVQRRRSAGWSAPLDEHGRRPVYVGRGTRWGNPFAVGAPHPAPHEGGRPIRDRAEAVALFELHIGVMGMHEWDAGWLAELRRDLGGRDLMCWCPAGEPCHADVLLRLANAA